MRKHLVFNAVIATISLVLAASAAELLLRVVDFPPSNFSPWVRDSQTAYRYAQGLSTRMTRPGEYDIEFRTNAAGLRDEELQPKNGPRVLLLGDSFTSGYGVTREQTFGALLENQLGIEVINAGVGGYELIHQLQYFRARGADLDADLVVLMLYLGNDLARNHEWERTESGGLRSVARTFPLRVTGEFKLLRLARQLRYRRRVRSASQQPWRPFPDYLALCRRQPGADAQQAYATSKRLVGEIRAAVESTGANFLVAMFSYRTAVEPEAAKLLAAELPDFDRDYDLLRPSAEMAAFFDREAIEYLDLVPLLRRDFAEYGEALYFPVDGHFNPLGNQRVAAHLATVLAGRPALASARD